MYRIIILPITEHVLRILSLNKIVKILILDETNEKFREALRKFYIFFNFRAQLFHYSLQDISV